MNTSNCFKIVLKYHSFVLKLFGIWPITAKGYLKFFVYSTILVTTILTTFVLNAIHIFEMADTGSQSLPTTYIYAPRQTLLDAVLLGLLFISQYAYIRGHTVLMYRCIELLQTIVSKLNITINRKHMQWLAQFMSGSLLVNTLRIAMTISNTYHSVDRVYTSTIIHLTLSNIMYIIISTFENHFYAVIIVLAFQYTYFNRKISHIMDVADILSRKTNESIQRRYQTMQSFCNLSDQLDEMSILHNRLCDITNEFIRIYRFQIILIITWKFYLFIVQTYQEFVVVTSFVGDQTNHYYQVLERLALWLLNFVGIFAISHFSAKIQSEVNITSFILRYFLTVYIILY